MYPPQSLAWTPPTAQTLLIQKLIDLITVHQALTQMLITMTQRITSQTLTVQMTSKSAGEVAKANCQALVDSMQALTELKLKYCSAHSQQPCCKQLCHSLLEQTDWHAFMCMPHHPTMKMPMLARMTVQGPRYAPRLYHAHGCTVQAA